MTALIDIDYFKRQPYGGKGLDANLPAEVLQETIEDASQYVEDYLDMRITETAYTERIVGNGRYTLILDNFPITSVTGVSYEDVVGNVGTYSPTQFLIHAEAGIIERIDKLDVFREDRIYIISYTAGYTEVPGPIKRAVALQTVQFLRPAYGGVNDSSGEIVPFADELIVSLLERYRRKRLS